MHINCRKTSVTQYSLLPNDHGMLIHKTLFIKPNYPKHKLVKKALTIIEQGGDNYGVVKDLQDFKGGERREV